MKRMSQILLCRALYVDLERPFIQKKKKYKILYIETDICINYIIVAVESKNLYCKKIFLRILYT